MADKSGFPRWLLNVKEDLNGSKEWNLFISDLQDAINHQLRESRSSTFSDLSDAEKSLLVTRAAKLISTGASYQGLASQIGQYIDQHINNEVSKELLEDFPVASKTDMVLDNVSEGAVSLLSKWPEMKAKLKAMLNHPLPYRLRTLAWRYFLEDTTVRQDYLHKLRTDSREVVSPMNAEISEKCQQIIDCQPAFQEIKGHKGAFYLMTSVLSYYHACKRSRSTLTDNEYFLTLPFILTSMQSLSMKEQPSSKLVVSLVEEYVSFMGLRPGFMDDSGTDEDKESLQEFVSKVIENLKHVDKKSLEIIREACQPPEDMIITTKEGKRKHLLEDFSAVICPVIRCMFVGFLNVESMLYIWDQYMMGVHNCQYKMECLSAYVAIVIKLLSHHLKDCQSSTAMQRVIQTQGPKLQTHQFQYQIKKYFVDKFKKLLKEKDEDVFPVLDPTQAWSHWNREVIPDRTTSVDRRRARDLRLADRQRVLEEEREQWEKIIAEEESKRKTGGYLPYLQLDSSKPASRSQHNNESPLNQLENERRDRIETERKLQAEINMLREELRAAHREQRPLTTLSLETVVSRYIMPAPANTPQDGIVQYPIPIHSIVDDEAEEVKNILTEMIKKVHISTHKVAHGAGRARSNLDKETLRFINLHKEHLKKAEMKVFGHYLGSNEFDSLPSSQKEIKSAELMTVIQELIEEDHERQERR